MILAANLRTVQDLTLVQSSQHLLCDIVYSQQLVRVYRYNVPAYLHGSCFYMDLSQQESLGTA